MVVSRSDQTYSLKDGIQKGTFNVSKDKVLYVMHTCEKLICIHISVLLILVILTSISDLLLQHVNLFINLKLNIYAIT